MPHRLTCLTLAVIMAASAVTAQEELHPRTMALPGLSDFTLTDDRAVCSGGKSAIVAARMAEEHPNSAIGSPDPAIHCPAVLAEIAKRGRLRDMYSFMVMNRGVDLGDNPRIGISEVHALASQDGGQEHLRIFNAAIANETSYLSVIGDERSIYCELAYDAGFYYGYYNAEAEVAKQTPDEALNTAAERCFTDGRQPTLNAVLAGIRHGQKTAKQH